MVGVWAPLGHRGRGADDDPSFPFCLKTMNDSKLTAKDCIDAGAALNPHWTPRFKAFAAWVLDRETVFKRGAWGDYRQAIWEKVSGDAGGVTKFGIDQRSHPSCKVEYLNAREAVEIYWWSYWVASCAGSYPFGYGEILCDVRINGGNGPKLLQAALNDCGAKLKVDGVIGLCTVEAMERYRGIGWEPFIKRRETRYRLLAKKASMAKFLDGWLDRMRLLRKYINEGVPF